MTDAFIEGFLLVFQWPALGYLLLGILIGIWLGAVPGLSGVLGLVLLLPFTFGMDPVPAIALLLGMYSVTTTSDTIASIMLGIPGTAASQATILDGYPLAQRGEARRALGAAFAVSAFGGVFGALALAVSLPVIRPLVLSFASPEFFMLGVLGLAMVGMLSGRSMLKGVAAAAVGLLIAMIGYAETSPVPRLWFGVPYLLDGIPIIPIVLGLFALPELMELAIRDTSISRVPANRAAGGGMLDGVRDAVRHWWLTIRCALIGTYVGMLPGLGSSIVDWLAYGHAVQSAKDRSQFGKGDIRGVIAPEAANNASKGGSLVPALAFGIPGNLGTVILLGALLIQGLRPGPEMLGENLPITFSMVWTIAIANVVVTCLLLAWAGPIARLTFLPGHLVVPGVILFVLMGAWLASAQLGDWITCLAMGVLGFVMKRSGWPRPPLILALVLGSLMESRYLISVSTYDYAWLTRPIVLIIAGLIVLTLAYNLVGHLRDGPRTEPDDEAPGAIQAEGAARQPLLSVPLAALFLAAFAYALVEALAYPANARTFPLLIASLGGVLAIAVLVSDGRRAMAATERARGLRAAIRAMAEETLMAPAAVYFGYVAGAIALAVLIGQKLALPVFVYVYLRRWGGYRQRVALGYAAGAWVILVGFYESIIRIYWYPAVLAEWLYPYLPPWFPAWMVF